MDFDKPKVYGDTSIADGLVLMIFLSFEDCQLPLHHPLDLIHRKHRIAGLQAGDHHK